MIVGFRQQKTLVWGSLVGGWLIAAGITLQTFSQMPLFEPAPAPTILKPLFGEVLESGFVTVAGVTKNDTNVLVFVDGVQNGRIRVKNHPSGTASFSWQPSHPLKEGTYAMWVVAESELGLSLPSETIEFTIRKPYPRPTMHQPVVNTATTYRRPHLVGVARSGDDVELMLDGVVIGKVSASVHASGVGSFQMLPPKDLELGWHSVHARSITKTGIMSPWSDAYVFGIATTSTPVNQAAGITPQLPAATAPSSIPAPTLLRPTAQSFVTAGNWTIAGVVHNGYIVQLFLDAVLLTELAPADHPSGVTAFLYRPSAKLPHGDHHIFARAVDRDGRYSALSQSVPVIIRPTVPRLTLVTQSGVIWWPPAQGAIASGVKVSRVGLADGESRLATTTPAHTPTTSTVLVIERPASEMTGALPQQQDSTSTALTPETAGPTFESIPTIEDLEVLLEDAAVTSTPYAAAPPVVTTDHEAAEPAAANGSSLSVSTPTAVTLENMRQRLQGSRPGALVLILSGIIILVGIIVTFIRDRLVAKRAKQVDFTDAGSTMSLRREEPVTSEYKEIPAMPPPPTPPAI